MNKKFFLVLALAGAFSVKAASEVTIIDKAKAFFKPAPVVIKQSRLKTACGTIKNTVFSKNTAAALVCCVAGYGCYKLYQEYLKEHVNKYFNEYSKQQKIKKIKNWLKLS